MPLVDALTFHRRLAGYEPSPLVPVDSIEIAGAAGVLVKLESSRFGLPSFKVLGASWAVFRAAADWLEPGRPPDGDIDRLRAVLSTSPRRPTVVAATDGNHGRAVAWTARQLGIGSLVIVPDGTAQARIDAIAGEGATVRAIDGDYDDAVAAAAAADAACPDVLLVQDTAVPGHEAAAGRIVDGYATIFAELDEQLRTVRGAEAGIAIVVPVGVGSLALAAARYARGRTPRARLVTAEPVEAASLAASLRAGALVAMPGPHVSAMVGLRCGTISSAAWPELRETVDAAAAIDDAETDAAMLRLAAVGIEVGECGAAPLAALSSLEQARRLPWSAGGAGPVVVLVATEGPTDIARWTSIVGRRPVSG